MSLDAEQQEILDYMDHYCGGLDVRWNKFKGDVVCRIVKRFIENHLSPRVLNVAGPNVYLKGFPNEFDLMIVDADAKPRELTCCFDPRHVHSVLEVKKGGIYSPRQPERMSEIFDEIISKHPNIKCAYLTVEEVFTTSRPTSKNFYRICKEELRRHGFFALRNLRGQRQLIPSEWEKFLSFILEEK